MPIRLPQLTRNELAGYFDRIGLCEPPAPDLDGITSIHQHHVHSIPFENLDIHMGVEIRLDPDAVFDKLVMNRRGGFCYEHNSLLARALMGMGIDVDLLSSRVASGPRGWGPPFDHMTLGVSLGESLLLDVGFGDSFKDPLPMERWSEDSNGHAYRALQRQDGIVIQRQTPEPRMGRLYLTDPQPRQIDDFAEMCTFQQTSPDVWFTQRWVVTLPLEDGRITAAPGSFTRVRSGIRRRIEILSALHLTEILQADFGMLDIDIGAHFPFGAQTPTGIMD